MFPVRRLTLSFQFAQVLDPCWSSQPPWTATQESSIHWPSSSLVKRPHKVLAIRHRRQLYLVGLLLSPIVQTLTPWGWKWSMLQVKRAHLAAALSCTRRGNSGRGGAGVTWCEPSQSARTGSQQHNKTWLNVAGEILAVCAATTSSYVKKKIFKKCASVRLLYPLRNMQMRSCVFFSLAFAITFSKYIDIFLSINKKIK